MTIKDYFSNAKKHFNTINRHRKEVRKNCFRCGLYKQGLLHDLSKYSWTEFSQGVKYFQGDRSPNDAEREDKGYTSAWLHHKGRNKHHLEYWVDYDVKKSEAGMVGMKMPDNYIIEMFCDRVAASKIYQGDKYTDASPIQYYEKGKGKYILHPYVRKKLELLLNMLAEKGEKYTFAYARKWLKAYKKRQKRSCCCCKCCCQCSCGK
ncbi:MAG: catalase [Eubacterium sp.]|nr:catalase [Eubacterium sp.]MBR1857786.1 catalase [Oribacterium sp.]